MKICRALAAVLVFVVVPPASVRTPDAWVARALAQAAPVFTPEQLDQLLAPIALYPDPLLVQILIAATYPLEVVQAARWVQDPSNAALRGNALTLALQNQDWDPSVKSLVPFPQILAMLNSRLDWMQALGDAFLAQQAEVMDSVQRLRRQAEAAGTLVSTAQQAVTATGPMIEIEPASPGVISVPCYNPTVVYGAWPYPAFPPLYVPPPGCVVGSAVTFGIGISVVPFLWGWSAWDWDHHRIRVDADRFNRIDVHRHLTGDTWEHDPYHRRGVIYRNPGTTARFTNIQPGAPAPSRDFRGYERGSGIVAPRPRPAPAPAIVPRTPPAFESFGKGTEVRGQAERGHMSLQTMPRSAPRPPSAAPSPSRGGGAHR